MLNREDESLWDYNYESFIDENEEETQMTCRPSPIKYKDFLTNANPEKYEKVDNQDMRNSTSQLWTVKKMRADTKKLFN